MSSAIVKAPPWLRSIAGLPVRVVNAGPLGRPQAANAALEAAQGEWMLFLDEDDEIAPAHVAQLLAAANATGLPVASDAYIPKINSTARRPSRPSTSGAVLVVRARTKSAN